MLPVIIYEPYYRTRFFPLHDFQPLWEIRTGILKTRERFERLVGADNVFLLPPENMLEVASSFCPKSQILTIDTLPQEAIYVSSALITNSSFDVFEAARSDITYHCKRLTRLDFLDLSNSGILDVFSDAEGDGFLILRQPWEVITNLERIISWDGSYFSSNSKKMFANVIGSAENVFVDDSAQIQPQVVFDTTKGAIVVDRNAQVQSFSHLIGPIYVGEDTIVLGGRISASSFGRNCRVAGEISNSVFQDFVNKGHAGFIGHSYAGHFTNFGAMTTNSNLKNTYGNIRLKAPDRVLDTGVNKFGMICGPHTKFGIGTLIPTGSLIGGFCNLFFGGSFIPKLVNHFVWSDGQNDKIYRFDQAVKTASIMAGRRGQEFSAAETKVALSVYRRVFKP